MNKTNLGMTIFFNPRRTFLLTISISFMLILLSCGKVEKQPEVFIRIGDKTVSYREFQRSFNEYISELKKEYLKEYIHDCLIELKADELGITPTKEQIEKYAKFVEENIIDTPLDKYLKTIGLTKEQWEKKIKKDITKELVIQKEVHDKIEISEEDIKLYYQENREDFFFPKKYHIYQILTHSLEEAKTIKSKLKITKLFETVAKEYSKSPDGKKGGDIGFILLEDLPIPAQEELRCLETKKISDIVSSDSGYYIYMIKEIKPPGFKPLDEVKNKIKDIITKSKREEELENWLKNLEGETNIQVNFWDYDT
ncbi:peptidyl-prolyl cis-trans isomerase [bacterium]|nr:peptidyl-prolyl cis-trans isomerase [bacterium]